MCTPLNCEKALILEICTPLNCDRVLRIDAGPDGIPEDQRSEIDFFYVETGYTHRLLREDLTTKEQFYRRTNLPSDLHVACVLDDPLWDTDQRRVEYVDDLEIYEFLKARENANDPWNGGVVFTNPITDALYAIDRLRKIGYCGCCYSSNIIATEVYVYTDLETGKKTTFAVISMDTESG